MKECGDEEQNDEDDCCNHGRVVSVMVSSELIDVMAVLLVKAETFSISRIDRRTHDAR